MDLFSAIGAGMLVYGMTVDSPGYTWAGAGLLFLDIGGGAIISQLTTPLNNAIFANPV